MSETNPKPAKDLVYIKDDIWDEVSSESIDLCDYPDFWKNPVKYESRPVALTYSLRYLHRYASDAYDFFQQILTKNNDVETIVIVGSGNNADLIGLNYFVSELSKQTNKKYQVHLVDPIEWGYYPPINISENINLNIHRDCITSLNFDNLDGRKLVVYSRVLNEKRISYDERHNIAKTAHFVDNGDIVSSIRTNLANAEEDSENHGRLSVLLNKHHEHPFNEKSFSDGKELPLSSEFNYEAKLYRKKVCSTKECYGGEDCKAHLPARKSYSRYEVAIKKEGQLHDYFSQ